MRETIDTTFAELAKTDDMSMEEELQQQQAIDPLATDNLTQPTIEMIPINDNNTCDSFESIHSIHSKELERIKDRQRRQKRKRLAGYVRNRKLKRKLRMAKATASTESNKRCINPMSIDAINTNIPRMELPYKKFRNAMFEIISQNEILEHRTRVHRRTSEPFDYKRATAQPRSVSPKKITHRSLPHTVVTDNQFDNGEPSSSSSPSATAVNNNNRRLVRNPSSGIDSDDYQTCGSRNKRRINYSEELVDEAFMYEQILQDKQHHQQQKRKQSLTKPLDSKSLDGVLDAAVNSAAADAASGNIDSRLRLLEQRNEISIMPVRSRLMAKENKIDTQHMPIPIKTEPLFNITSSVSVHIKSRTDQPITQNIQISNITSLHKKPASAGGAAAAAAAATLISSPSLPPSKKRRKISCVHCQRTFSDEKHLAKHQLEHMKISAYKIDAIRILHPKLRRVSNSRKIHTN